MEFLWNQSTMCLSSLFCVFHPLFGAKTKGLPRGIAVRWALVLLALASGMGSLHAQRTERTEHVCSSTDIRNQVGEFRRLENCTVIEGSLHIQLIDYAQSSDYFDLSFPKLVEITEHLLMYRVYGLKTLSHIFPNLSVIRGQSLFYNYALVIFEMPNFEELGLPNLQVISRGAIRIEKNPNLCYIDTIDWTKITKVNKEDNFILQNKDIDECPNVCPKEVSSSGRQVNTCPSMEFEENGQIVNQFLCWNGENCQKICSDNCGDRGCYQHVTSQGRLEDRCCHEECLGGCSGPTPKQCFACRNVFYEGRCRGNCPPYTYEFLQRRCLLADECKSHSAGNQDLQTGLQNRGGGWKLFNGKCVEECPSGYTEEKPHTHKCIKCDGPCPKVCQGLVVDNVAAAQKLKGCTRIEGILEIQIRGGSHVGSELEENLGSIEEVKYYVKIVRSYAIISLRFLKNLRKIEGERLHNNRYALFVLDNQNLQDIWDVEKHPNLTIPKGRAFFHFNRKLCLNKIDQLIDSVPGLRNLTDEKDVDPSTNGDQVACDISKLDLEVIVRTATVAIVRWNNFHMSDARQLLSWVVNYREAPEKNITIFNARDACGTDDWSTDDVRPDVDLKAEHVASIIPNLKPFTQYAVYVQSYTIATADRGAMSSIVYFTTAPDEPTPVREIKAVSKIPGELHITWKEPSQPNGRVTHYYVYWQLQPLKKEKFDRRDYCVDKLRLPSAKKDDVIEDKKNETQNGNCCACPKSEEKVLIEEQERMFQIQFENFLHNQVYIKRPPKIKRKGRSVDSYYAGPVPEKSREKRFTNEGSYAILNNYTSYMNLSGHINQTLPEDTDVQEPYEAAVVYNKTELILTNLIHFQEYSIEVIACHDYEAGLDGKRCSNRAITTARTLADENADTVEEKNITVRNESEASTRVLIKWSDPPSPNGLVITYDLALHKADAVHFKPDTYCLTHKHYRTYMENGGYRTESLTPGSWYFRVRATSLAGNGSWTQPLHFWVAENVESPPMNLTMIIIVTTMVSLLVIAVVSASIYAIVRKKLNPNFPPINYISVNPEYWSTGPVYTPDEWEVDRDKISLLRELGQGSFGMVYEGQAVDLKEDQGTIKVAVKTVNEKASVRDRMEFLNEASVMKAFSCNHVVRLLGVVSSQPTWVIMELMANGDLKNYLRMHRPDQEDNNGLKPPSLKQILQMAGEISDGMAYLASKKYVHCDLAARNCMVAENNIVKIGDFGMTRDIYETDYYRKGGKGLLPVRWMAPESLKDGVFTSQSDVWSFGVVLWEMATLAAQPYQGLANEQVLKYVIDGGIMEKPEGCPDKLYEELMLKCWRHNPKHRPTFCEIIEILVPDLNPEFKDVSWFFSEDQAGTSELGDDVPEEDGPELDDTNVHTPLTGSPLHAQHNQDSAGDGSLDLDNIDADYESQASSVSLNAPGSQRKQLHPPRSLCSNSSPGSSGDIDCRKRNGNTNNSDINEWRARSPNNWTNHIDSPPNSAIHSNEGSKGSSKSSSSNHSQLNGIMNGHLPQHIAPPRC